MHEVPGNQRAYRPFQLRQRQERDRAPIRPPPQRDACSGPVGEALTLAPRFRKVEVIANVASGGVGPGAPEHIGQILAEAGIAANVSTPSPGELIPALRRSIGSSPDLLIILAGDGTARAAAELCGLNGPMIAPLPGGTMNMLPHMIYGPKTWPDALRAALDHGEERVLGGGEIGEHRFLVAAILGSPALWAPAREAARAGQLRKAMDRGRRAMQRAFTGRLRYRLDHDTPSKAEALVLLCPMASAVLPSETPALEAAAMDVRTGGDVLRLGLNALVRNWRVDHSVETKACQIAHIWAARAIPALLDGEIVQLGPRARARFLPAVVRVLGLPSSS